MPVVAKRASLPLTEMDLELLRRAADPATPEGKRLAALTDGRPLASEAQLLRAVLEIGFERLGADVMFEGYQQLAMSYESDDESAYATALKNRTRRHHADGE